MSRPETSITKGKSTCQLQPSYSVVDLPSSLSRYLYRANGRGGFGSQTVGSPEMWVWPQLVFEGPPPSPIVIGGPFPQAKPLPSPPSPSLFPPPPLALFARLRGGGGLAQADGGGGPPSGTWGQTHIWVLETAAAPPAPPPATPQNLRKGFWVTSGNLSPKMAASIYTL